MATVRDSLQFNKIVKATAVTLNSANTDVASWTTLPARIRVLGFTVHNPSTSLAASSATLGAYDAAAAGGNVVVTPDTQTALTGATKSVDMAIAFTDVITTGAIYARNGTAHGGAATVAIQLHYMDLT